MQHIGRNENINKKHTSMSAARKHMQQYLHKVFDWTHHNNLIINPDILLASVNRYSLSVLDGVARVAACARASLAAINEVLFVL